VMVSYFGRRSGDSTRAENVSTFLDRHNNPAILLAFGYSRTEDRTTKVLAVLSGRVVVRRITPTEFDAAYAASQVPPDIAARALESIARARGCDLEARRTLLLFLDAPAWKIKVVDLLIGICSSLREPFSGRTRLASIAESSRMPFTPSSKLVEQIAAMVAREEDWIPDADGIDPAIHVVVNFEDGVWLCEHHGECNINNFTRVQRLAEAGIPVLQRTR
jgi:hypothetical protein